MYKRSDWIELGFLLLAFVLLYFGTRFNLPILSSLGSASVGAFALVAGIQAIRTGRLGFETHQKNFGRITMYTGFSARLYGGLFIAFALLVFVLTGAALFQPGGAGAFWAAILSKTWGWGLILVCIGLVEVASGVIDLVSGSAGYYKGLADEVQRISGFVPLLFGLGLLSVGTLLIVLPAQSLNLVKGVLAYFVRWLSR